MKSQTDVERLIDCLSDDSQEWLECVAPWCIALGRSIGPRAAGIALAMLKNGTDNGTALNCVGFLARLGTPEGYEALADAMFLPLADEVLEQIFEDAFDSPALRRDEKFIEHAHRLKASWPHRELERFLERVRQQGT